MRRQPALRACFVLPKCQLQHLLQLVVHELDLGADDDLASVLAGTDDTGSTGSLDSLLVNLSVVEHLKAQAGCAVANVLHVLLAADSSQNSRSNLSVVIVGQNDLLLSLFVVILTAGGLQVELGDGEVEHCVEHHECSDAQRNDHPSLSSCGQRSGEHQVGGTCGEAEASTETGVVGDDGKDAVQSSVHNVQGEAQEHEAELEGLGNAADEGADCSRQNQADGGLLVLSGLDHSQSSAQDTEHHAGEEAGHVHTKAPAHISRGLASPEVGQVAQTDGIEPEHVVQSVVQAGGDEQTVQEGVDASADAAHASDAVATMIAEGGIYIEDYSDIEQQVAEIAHVDLIEQELLDKPRDTVIIHMYLEPGASPVETLALIAARMEAANIAYTVETEGVEQEDWQNGWRKYYHPLEIGKRLAVVPSWQQYDTDRVKLILDPGLAFGTGGHETTSLCMEALDERLTGGERVLDIGTGSGILAIAALKLGAAVAEGVDIDPVAVRTAGENAALNGVQDKLTVLVGDLSDKASGKYDIITANIVANAILSLAPAVPGLMAEDATFIASGIIDSRKDEVIAGLEKAGLAVVEVKEKRGWECIVCKKA